MIQQQTLQFLKELKKNNKKEWFEKNRPRFEESKKEFENFTADVIKKLSKSDESIAHLEPKQCTFRQNRDVRFSKDKSPYKSNMGMYLSKGGKSSIYAGYYFHLEPGKSMTAGGLWMPQAPELKKIRQEIDYNWDDFKKILQHKKFASVFDDLEKSGDTTLSRPPKGYEKDNPAIDYLKLKSLLASKKLTDAELGSKDLSKNVVSYFQALIPLVTFLNRAMED